MHSATSLRLENRLQVREGERTSRARSSSLDVMGPHGGSYQRVIHAACARHKPSERLRRPSQHALPTVDVADLGWHVEEKFGDTILAGFSNWLCQPQHAFCNSVRRADEVPTG